MDSFRLRVNNKPETEINELKVVNISRQWANDIAKYYMDNTTVITPSVSRAASSSAVFPIDSIKIPHWNIVTDDFTMTIDDAKLTSTRFPDGRLRDFEIIAKIHLILPESVTGFFADKKRFGSGIDVTVSIVAKRDDEDRECFEISLASPGVGRLKISFESMSLFSAIGLVTFFHGEDAKKELDNTKLSSMFIDYADDGFLSDFSNYSNSQQDPEQAQQMEFLRQLSKIKTYKFSAQSQYFMPSSDFLKAIFGGEPIHADIKVKVDILPKP